MTCDFVWAGLHHISYMAYSAVYQTSSCVLYNCLCRAVSRAFPGLSPVQSSETNDLPGLASLTNTMTKVMGSYLPKFLTTIRIRWRSFRVKYRHLTLSSKVVSNDYTSKCSWPYWSNPPFLIFDIRALWRSRLGARVPACQNNFLKVG